MIRLTVQDAVPFDTLVAYPTQAADSAIKAGPFTILASPGAPIVAETKFPVVLFSHGNGRRAGSPLIHRDIIFALARHGFVVVAPFHPGTAKPFLDRPRHIRLALEHVIADKRFGDSIDRDRVGMIGFSFGGAVTLIVSGAIPSIRHLSAYCRDRTNDPRACEGVPANIPADTQDLNGSPDVLPLRALVLLEPFGAVFDQQGLRAVPPAVLLYRAEQSDLAAEGNIFALAKALPQPPSKESVQGGHFVFIGPCPAELEATQPLVCKDAVGVDRTTIQESVQARVLGFLRSKL
jgi:predicted dienelactone hydrolase